MTDFKLSDAVCDVSAALLDAEGLQAYEQAGKVTRGCYDLLRDIDITASKLKLLQAQGVPVISDRSHRRETAGTGGARTRKAISGCTSLCTAALPNITG